MSQNDAFPQDAYETLVDRVHRPVFLEKLARDWNVVPASPQEEFQLLELAGMLREAKAVEAEKSAGAGGNNFLTDASDSLKGALAQLGYGHVPTSHDQLVKRAAAQLSQDPAITGAVAALGGYLASQSNMPQ